MQIHVRLFGSLRELAGASELSVELVGGGRVADLRRQLAEKYSEIEKLGTRLAISVNLEVVDSETQLCEGDEVALLPPVAGGDGSLCTISHQPLDEAEVVARVAGDDTGGIVSFVGTVRDHSRGHSIKFLEYEAYPEMAEKEMAKIVAAAGERWPGIRVAIAHRVGRLEIGDAAVVVVAVAPHRDDAFEACRFAIDTLKVTVPIWKKEVASGGEYWVDDHA